MQTTQIEPIGGTTATRRALLDTLGRRFHVEALTGFALALALAFGIFALLLVAIGKDPLATFAAMYQGTLADSYGWGEVVVKMIPFILCALATAIPARVGLVNVGGEGQLY